MIRAKNDIIYNATGEPNVKRSYTIEPKVVEGPESITYLKAAITKLEDTSAKMGHFDTRHRRELLAYLRSLEAENRGLLLALSEWVQESLFDEMYGGLT